MTYTPFQFLRGNTAQNNAYTGQPGEITVDTELNQIRVHDGVTPGGHIIANQENASLDWNDIVNRPSGLISASQQYSTGSFTGSFAGLFTASGHLIPTQDEQFDLGSPSKKWRNIYLSGSTIYLGTLAIKDKNGRLVVENATEEPLAFSGSFTGSLFGTSSYALSASYVPNAVSSWDDLTGKPTVVSSSTQIALNAISGVSFSNQAFYFPQDITVEGKITAQEYHTEFISSSIIYQSGSTKFGDSIDDVHQITGSIYLSGSFIGTSIYANRAEITEKIDVIVGGSATGEGLYRGELTGSLYGTASYALNADGGKGFPYSGSAVITGSLLVSGSGVTVIGKGLTGSVFGTSSRATISEKVDVISGGSTTGEGVYRGEFTGSFYGTSSYALNAERTDKGFPFVGKAIITGSLIVSGSGITGSLQGTASNAISTSRADTTEKIDVISGGSTTGEGIYRGEFTGSLFGSASYALNAGKGDGFPYSGSAIITGSLLVSGSGITGSLQGTASVAISSSYSVTSSYAEVATSSSRSVSTEKIDVISGGSTTGEGIYRGEFTGSLFGTSSYALNAGKGDGFPYSGSAVITGSLLVSGSGITGSLRGTASNAISSSYATTASYAQQATSASYSITASYAESATSSSRSVSTEKIDVISGGSTTGEGVYLGEFTGSLYGTASYALNAEKGTGFPFSGSAEITGSLLISGSGLRTTGSISVFGNVSATGGFLGTSSYAQTSSYALFVLQDIFTGSFKGDGSQLYFNTLNTSQSSNSQLIIGNVYNNYQYKQTTVFRNAEVVISGSTTIADGGVLFMTPQEAPTPIAGGIFYSASGQFFVGTE